VIQEAAVATGRGDADLPAVLRLNLVPGTTADRPPTSCPSWPRRPASSTFAGLMHVAAEVDGALRIVAELLERPGGE
jgi:hypothetical protein